MQFIDHTGHMFHLPSYDVEPIGYEFDEMDYVFWLNSDYSFKLSVNTYYIKPIRFLFKHDHQESGIKGGFSFGFSNGFDNKSGDLNYNIEISSNSKKFSLLGSRQIQEMIERNDSALDGIKINEESMKKSYLTVDDLCIIDNLEDETGEEWSLCTFYVVCYSDEPGTWETNILIKTTSKDLTDWCPITVGSEIVDEIEELNINALNVGIRLPKDIVRAMYQSNCFDEHPDENLYNQKMKELLMNFMLIKGQEGNYKSMINALKWFGWGDKLTIYKLLKNDNEIIDQYIRDTFDLSNDVLYSFRHFRNDALVSISMRIDYEGEQENFNFDNEFWGENKPEIKSYFKNPVVVHYDEGDLDFYKNYFDFTLSELSFKLCMLKYYYEKYFLPIHIHLSSVSTMQTVWMNDIKMLTNCSPKITAEPIFIKDKGIDVKFPPYKELIFGAYEGYFDKNFNVFSDTLQTATWQNIYYIHDTLIVVPIKFISNYEEQFFDVRLSLYKDDECVLVNSFQFTQTEYSYYKEFIIHPKTINKDFNINDWLDSSYRIEIYANGNNYSYEFRLKMPEVNITMGTLDYMYDDRFRQIKSIIGENVEFNAHMYEKGLVSINNIDLIDDLNLIQSKMDEDVKLVQENFEKYVDKYYKSNVVLFGNKYLNRCHFFKIYKKEGQEYVDDFVPQPVSYDDDTSKIFSISFNDNKYVWDLRNDYDEIYESFFNNDGSLKTTIELSINSNEMKLSYDFFLMREGLEEKDEFGFKKTSLKSWYAVLISKETINDCKESDLDPLLKEFQTGNHKYKLEYEGSDSKFLINRYFFNSRDTKYLIDNNGQTLLDENEMPVLNPLYGIHHFKEGDIIAFYLRSNDKLSYKLRLTPKWEISPASIGMSTTNKVTSPNEVAIVSIGKNNFRYERGYYTIKCMYSIDNFVQESMQKKMKFRVD